MKVMQITHEHDINAHLMGEVVVGLPPNEVHVPVIVVEPGYVLSIGVPLSGLIVLLEPTASVSIPDEVLPQCRGLQVFRCILQAREDGVVTFGERPMTEEELRAAWRKIDPDWDEDAHRERQGSFRRELEPVLASTAATLSKAVQKIKKMAAEKPAKKAKKPAKKVAKKRVAKPKRAAKPKPVAGDS